MIFPISHTDFPQLSTTKTEKGNFKVKILSQSPKNLYFSTFFPSLHYLAVADKKYLCHILKPLERIDIPGLAGVSQHFLLFILLAYPGIK
nr:hypothetical protein [uncultured Acetatifactor sp.]